MTAKEEKYRKENPKATPYDMLVAKVINEKRYNELESQPAPQPVHSEKLQPVLTKIEMPVYHEYQSNRMAVLVDLTNGKRTEMSLGRAEAERRKYPQRYKIQ